MADKLTRPHDYRALFSACPDLTIVGGQAVNLWAITYLDEARANSERFGSSDLDVLARMRTSDIVAALPEWNHEKTPLWAFGDGRVLTLTSNADDGRPLVVEVLHAVPGLDQEDLDAVVAIQKDGVTYRLLDPVAILKAKATSIRLFDQTDRQDRPHLQIIAKCLPLFLRDAHQQAVEDAALQAAFCGTLRRTFKALTDRPIRKVLRQEGINLHLLIPPELSQSPIEKVRTACLHQLSRLAD